MRASVFAFLLALAAWPCGAAEKEPEKKKPLTASAELSYVDAGGNTEAATLSTKGKLAYEGKKNGWELEAGALGSSGKEGTTAEQYFATEKLLRKKDERNYVFERLKWDKDRFAGIRNRLDGTVGVGRKILDKAKDELTVEIGPGYIHEERIGSPTNSFVSARIYSKYTRTLSETASFTQDAEYVASLERAEDYRASTETALTAALNSHLSLKTSFRWKRSNAPPSGFVKDDTLLSAAILLNY